MHDSSIFKIRIDFTKSHDSYLYDKDRRCFFLDFFGLYSSLPLGYSHPIFRTKGFREESGRIAAIKIPNCEIVSDEAKSFLKVFTGQPEMRGFKYFHFCCTGALAIEAALKIAIDQKRAARPPVVISMKESFHGINSYGGFVTDRFYPVSLRLDGFPEMGWCKITNPKIVYKTDGTVDRSLTDRGMDRFIDEFGSCVKKYGAKNIAALLIEPVQSTYGDNYFPKEFFETARRLCDRHGICLIFDEVQTGFGVSGRMWYFEHCGIVPDIVAFGKKSQVSGVMVSKAYDKTFRSPIRLEVTWDGNLLDMVRAKYVMEAYRRYGILDNVRKRSAQLYNGLKNIGALRNTRACGLLVAFDLESQKQRDLVFDKMIEERFMGNKTRDHTIRLRPNLNVSESEVQEALRRIRRAASG